MLYAIRTGPAPSSYITSSFLFFIFYYLHLLLSSSFSYISYFLFLISSFLWGTLGPCYRVGESLASVPGLVFKTEALHRTESHLGYLHDVVTVQSSVCGSTSGPSCLDDACDPVEGIIIEDKTDPEHHTTHEFQPNEIFKASDIMVDALTKLLDNERNKRKVS